MKKRTPHTNTFNAYALFLALLIFTAFGGKEVHILLEHGHSDLEICDVKTGDVHLHDYEELEHGCSLCDFTLSFFTFSLPQFTVLKHIYSAPTASFAYFSNALFLPHPFIALRGPPVAA